MTAAISLHAVRHRYRGADDVLKGVSFDVPEASIFGFVGPNGAGKTTAIRLLLGLLRLQHGDIRVLGHDVRQAVRQALCHVGSLVEGPSLYGQLSARENLECWRLVFGVPRTRIDTVLTLVDLRDTGRQPVSEFSLGMRQRLGVAIALLHAPRLLVLDEPTNGLDPHGIVGMRRLLSRLAVEERVTVFVSSHLLDEMERLASHLCVLHEGLVVELGTMREVASRAGGSTRVTCNAPEAVRELLHAHGIPVRVQGQVLVLPALPQADVAAVVHRIVHAGHSIYAVDPGRSDLTEYFSRLTHVGSA